MVYADFGLKRTMTSGKNTFDITYTDVKTRFI